MALRRIYQPVIGLIAALSLSHWSVTAQSKNSGKSLSALSGMVSAATIEQMKLIGPNTGWVSTGDRLLWTGDNGAHWKDVSPENPKHDHLASVFFLDASAGWALYTHSVSDGERQNSAQQIQGDWTFWMASTRNGGKSWARSDISGLAPDMEKSLDGVGQVAFVDPARGWMELHHSMTWGSLLSTTDGGQSWHVTGHAPDLAADISLSPAGALFLAGSDGTGDSKLYASFDSGRDFTEISLAAPHDLDGAYQATYSAPLFANGLHGFEVVTYSGGQHDASAGVLYVSEDGGRRWAKDSVLRGLEPSSVGQGISFTVAGSTWILPTRNSATEDRLMRLPSGSSLPAERPDAGRSGSCRLSFLSASEGWMKCGAKLSATQDGGNTWRDIAPHVRDGKITAEPLSRVPPTAPAKVRTLAQVARTTRSSPPKSLEVAGLSSGISQRLGFETRRVPSVDQMQTWWNSSPYYDVGIYLPGSPNRGKDTKLTSGWITAVSGQGWGLIPTWFGLQAPAGCTKRQFETYSSDPTQARADGSAQASLAYASATNLGLDGSIVYLDMEDFDHAHCGPEAQAFLGGFVAQYHALGGLVGAYGGQYNAVQDFGLAEPQPDEIWIARKDQRVTVWGLGHGLSPSLPDTTWDSRKRIHQYNIDTDETWGGVTIHVDSDLVDAVIVPSSGTKLYSFASPVAFGPTYASVGGLANGINAGGATNMGAVVGFDPNAANGFVYSFYGWRYAAGTTYLPAPPGGLSTEIDFGPAIQPQAINNLGEVVGSYYDAGFDGDADQVFHGFIYSPGNGKYHVLDFPGAIWNYPISINDAGWVIGTYITSLPDNPYDQHCVLWKPPYKTPISFDSIGAIGACGARYDFGSTWIQPQINGIGQIAATAVANGDVDDWDQATGTVILDDVQNSAPSSVDSVAFLAVPSGAEIYETYGFNNNGQIAGWYINDEDWDTDAGFFINTDGVVLAITNPWGGFSGLNDEVQMVFPMPFASQASVVDSQH